MANTVLPSVNIFIIRDSEVLLNRRINTGWMDGHLCAPGGHVEEGESPIKAALRELKEELGLDLKSEDLEFLCVAARNTSPNRYVSYEFIVRKPCSPNNNEPNLCSELVWVDPKNLPEDVIPDFAEIITKSIVGNEKYLEIRY